MNLSPRDHQSYHLTEKEPSKAIMKSKLFGLAKAGFESASYREMSEHSINDIIEILDWALNGSFCDPGPAFQDMEFITDTFGIRKMIGVDSVNSNELEAVFENIALWAGTAYYNIQHQDKKTILFTLDMLSGSPHFDSIYIEVSFLLGYNQLDSTDFGYPYSLSCIDCCHWYSTWDATDELQRDLRLARQERVQLPFFFTDHHHICFSPEYTCYGLKLSEIAFFDEYLWDSDVYNPDQNTNHKYEYFLYWGPNDCLEEIDMDFYFNSMKDLIDENKPSKKVASSIYVGWELILGLGQSSSVAFHIMHTTYSEIRERVVPYEEYFDYDLSDGPYPLPY